MVGRSLKLSEQGEQQARQALVYKSLTQKAIAVEEGIASWATVNRFFNRKPVDRFIFQEICQVLDLDWTDVVEREDTLTDESISEPEIQAISTQDQQLSETTFVPVMQSDLLEQVRSQSAAAREALTPRILERISRQVVREKYLSAIDRGVTLERERLIPIIGPAGYGKSTILGDIYDQLLAKGTVWVGLVLCSNLSLSTSYLGGVSYGLVSSTFAPNAGQATDPLSNQQTMLDQAMGQSLCGDLRSLIDVAQELNQTLGRGVLLIDTLDLVINRDFVRIFGALMRQLLAQGTTVVFTCRHHEYNDYLEPVHQRLPGLGQSIDRYAVPNFSTEEIQAAATAFFRRLAPDDPERGQAFADKVLALSADNRSLREILENPLLLALLCDLFGAEGNVPPDLTVSKLYQRYWQEKVTYSRIDQSHYAPLAIAKEDLCLRTAERLFDLSKTRLYESFYRDEMGLEFTPDVTAAYSDLLSEGVLTQLPSGKLHFFHQTLLEYAIAYWLTRQSAQAQRAEFFRQLSEPDTVRDSSYWLPVLRQFLAIVDEAEFELWTGRLDLEHMGIFGAVAYAAVSRDRPDALRQLLPVALKLGETHQRRLRQALMAAPRTLIERIWDVLLTLLREAEHVTASNTVQMIGELLERWWSGLWSYLPDTLTAIADRPLVEHAKYSDGYDDRVQLLGWLLQPCMALIQANSEPELLRALRQQVHLMGHGTAAGVIQCHELASPEAQQDLLRRLLKEPIPRYEDIRQALADLVTGMLPQHVTIGQFPLGQTWSEVLHTVYPDQWNKIQIRAVGQWAAQDEVIFRAMLDDYLFGAPERIGRNLNALIESIESGAGDWMVRWLQELTPEQRSDLPLDRLTKLLPSSPVVSTLSAETQEALAQWLLPYLSSDRQVQVLCPLLNMLADAAPTARRQLEARVDGLPPKLRQQMQHQLLRFQPIATHPPLQGMKSKDQRFLIMVYRQQASEHPAALAKLIEVALGKSNDAAVSASHELDQVSGGQVSVADLLPLLKSPFVGVRVNGLAAIARVSQLEPLSLEQMQRVCRLLAQEDNQTVARYFCELGTDWVRRRQRVPKPMVRTLAGMLTRVADRGLLEGGLGRALIAVLKVIARSEDAGLDVAQLSGVVHQLLTSLPVTQIKNGESEMIDVLCAVHRLHSGFLRELVDGDCPLLLERDWMRNVAAIIKAVRKLEGERSPLLDEVMRRYGDLPMIESVILETKGI
ncbi:MAG: hypothetical protein ACTS2F_07750 [Thainema sp.]